MNHETVSTMFPLDTEALLRRKVLQQALGQKPADYIAWALGNRPEEAPIAGLVVCYRCLASGKRNGWHELSYHEGVDRVILNETLMVVANIHAYHEGHSPTIALTNNVVVTFEEAGITEDCIA